MKTIKIQIALAVDANGNYYAHADDGDTIKASAREANEWIDDEFPSSTYIVEVEVPVPESQAPVVVQGKIVSPEEICDFN